MTKTDFDAKLSSLNRKITKNKSKHLLVENELNKLKTSDSGYFIGKSHFGEDGAQNYLVFQPMGKYFKIDNSDYVLSWESKGLPNESITPPSAPKSSQSPSLKFWSCLFGAVTLTKNVNIDSYGYSGYGIGFDRKGSFSCGGYGQNVLILGVDMSFSAHIDSKKRDILVLRWGPTQGLEHTLTAEKMYSIHFTERNKKFCLSLH